MRCRRRGTGCTCRTRRRSSATRAQAQRRRGRCGVPGALAAVGDLTVWVYLSAGGARVARFGAQAHAAGEEPHGAGVGGGEHAVARDGGRDAQLRGTAADRKRGGWLWV